MANIELQINDKKYNKAWIDDLFCTSQISNDSENINYGVIGGYGSATMRDLGGEIKSEIQQGNIPVSNAEINVKVNNNQMQEHITSDSDYDIIDKQLKLSFQDRLTLLDVVTYVGMPLRDYSMTAYEMLDDVIGSYGEYCKACPINWVKYQNGTSIITASEHNSIVVNTASGYEIVGTPIRVIVGKHYTINYSITVGTAYTSNSGIPLQVLSAAPSNSDCQNITIAKSHLGKSVGSYSGTIEFDAPTNIIYLVLNFGWASDGQEIVVSINSIDVNGKSLEKATENKVWGEIENVGTSTMPIGDKLNGIKIGYPYLVAATYRETIEKFCTLAQITLALNEDGEIEFFDARPLKKNETALNVPDTYKISNLNKSLFVKNKFDGVNIKQNKVEDEDIAGDNVYNWDSGENEYTTSTDKSGEWLSVPTYIEVSYYHGSFTVPQKSNENRTTIKRLSEYEFSVSGTHRSGTVSYISSDGGSGYRANYTDSEQSIWTISKFSESNISGGSTASVTNKQSVNITLKDGYWQVDFVVPVGQKYYYYEVYSGNVRSELHAYDAEKLSISFYGDKREVSFKEVDLSSANIENAKTVVSIPTSELMQNEDDVITIRENILNDYRNGVATGNIDLFCGLGDWANGEIIQPNDLVQFSKENTLWRVTSRTFKYNGAPTLSLELQEQHEVKWRTVFEGEYTTVLSHKTSTSALNETTLTNDMPSGVDWGIPTIITGYTSCSIGGITSETKDEKAFTRLRLMDGKVYSGASVSLYKTDEATGGREIVGSVACSFVLNKAVSTLTFKSDVNINQSGGGLYIANLVITKVEQYY